MSKFLLLLALVAGSAFGADQKISAPSGNLILDAKAGSVVKVNKTLQVDSIKNFAGTSGAPGMVPIGGMVAVMPTTHANAWQPPATGVIKDGFMRADGAVVPTCADCVIPAGTVTPSMINRYPRGNTTSGSNGTGANTVTLGAANIPTTTGTITAGTAAGQTLGTTNVSLESGIAAGQSIVKNSGNHNHGGSTAWGGATDSNGDGYVRIDSNLFYTVGTAPGTVGVQEAGTHAHVIGNDVVNIDHTHGPSSVSGTTNIGHTHGTSSVSGSVSVGSASPTAVNNEPAYTEVVWIIRVK